MGNSIGEEVVIPKKNSRNLHNLLSLLLNAVMCLHCPVRERPGNCKKNNPQTSTERDWKGSTFRVERLRRTHCESSIYRKGYAIGDLHSP